MPREGRSWLWPRCLLCGRWLDWQRIELLGRLEDPWTCKRCAKGVVRTVEEDATHA